MGALLLYIDVKDCPKPVSSTTPPRNRDKMIFSNVAGGQTVLLVWADLGPDPKHFQDSVEQLQSLVGVSQKVSVENVERLGLANYQPGLFDKIFSGCVGLATINHDLDRLGQLTKLLKPGGQLSFVQCVRSGEDPASLSSSPASPPPPPPLPPCSSRSPAWRPLWPSSASVRPTCTSSPESNPTMRSEPPASCHLPSPSQLLLQPRPVCGLWRSLRTTLWSL